MASAGKNILMGSPNSPFVHKVCLVAVELGIRDRVVDQNESVYPLDAPSDALAKANPLGKIPALVTPTGTAIVDSGVINQFLDNLVTIEGAGKKGVLPPPTDPARFTALTCEALVDGCLDSLILMRYEIVMHPEDKRHHDWYAAQETKAHRAIQHLLAHHFPTFPSASTIATVPRPLSLNAIAFATLLWYLGRRWGSLEWWKWENGEEARRWYDEVQKREGWEGEDKPLK